MKYQVFIVGVKNLITLGIPKLLWCTQILLYFGVTLLKKLLWAIKRNPELFGPSRAVKLNLILILTMADVKWRHIGPKKQNFNVE